MAAKRKVGSNVESVGTNLQSTLREMGRLYREDPVVAVRGQGFISLLHEHIGALLDARLTDAARSRGISVEFEETVYGSTKPKDVDIIVWDPTNGPLILVGIRSQMSSVGKNVLTYYEGIVGECISLQDRFPMAIHGYVYLHPLAPIMRGAEEQSIDHVRYARMYAAISRRDDAMFKLQRGIYDVFAYMIVDFNSNPPRLCDQLLAGKTGDKDLRLSSFVDGIVSCFKKRELFIDLFK